VWEKHETAFGGGCFILDSRFRGNDKRISHVAKVLQIWWFPPRFYDPLLNLEAHYTIKASENQVIFGRFSLQLAGGGLSVPAGRYEGVRSAAEIELV
jgi:hypothetical protein